MLRMMMMMMTTMAVTMYDDRMPQELGGFLVAVLILSPVRMMQQHTRTKPN
eukprot:COSAG06_NODE_13350_length_1265_cov_4.157625_2_plen_51_part_00